MPEKLCLPSLKDLDPSQLDYVQRLDERITRFSGLYSQQTKAYQNAVDAIKAKYILQLAEGEVLELIKEEVERLSLED